MSVEAEWLPRFEEQLRRGDPLAASDILRTTGANGWVKKEQFTVALRAVDAHRPPPIVRLDWAQRLLAHPRRVDKDFAALVIAPLAVSHPKDVARAAHRLADDDDWEVREYGATLVGRLLSGAFEAFLPTACDWMKGHDARLRRAVVVGAKYAARERRPERAEALLDLIEPALRDHDEYVRKNLGPFAIGDGLLRAYPDATRARIARWAENDDPNVRWNAAMAFSAASAARHADLGMPLLEQLARDKDAFVRRGALAAQKRLLARARPAAAAAAIERLRTMDGLDLGEPSVMDKAWR